MYIKYYKWSKSEYKNLKKKFDEHLLLTDIQFYYPILSLFFNYHNNKRSKQTIDIYRRFRVIDIINCRDSAKNSSNKFLGCIVYDDALKSIKTKNLFLKSIPIIDIIYYCTNKYELNNNNKLPSNFNYNFNHKINDFNNTAYIDSFFSHIASELYLTKKTPSLAVCYGSYTGLGNFIYDIGSEYTFIKDEPFFINNIGKLFDLYFDDQIYDSTSDMSISTITSNNTRDSSTISSDDSNFSHVILLIKNIPLQQIILEKLEGTLEDYLKQDTFNFDIILSCFFQIVYCLAYLQKHYHFTHNDLHINNIMYTSTNIEYLYYKLNNIYFKVPTYGKIFKIIDFGRAVFDFKKKKYFSDSFSKYGDADGQYTYPIPNIPLFNNIDTKIISPNYSFDLCRLATTIIDELNLIDIPNNNEFNKFIELLNHIMNDKDNNSIYDPDNVSFQLYIDIANKSCNGIPKDILFSPIFDIFKISKSMIINKFIYTLN